MMRFIIWLLVWLSIAIPQLIAQAQIPEGERNVRFLKIEPDPDNVADTGKLSLGTFKEGEPITGTLQLRLVSTPPASRVTQSPLQVKLSGVQALGFTPSSDWYGGMTLRLAASTPDAEVLSNDTLMVKQLDPQGKIEFQVAFSFPAVPKASAFQALTNTQDEITGNLTFTFEYLNTSSTATLYNRITLPPVNFHLVVSRSPMAGIGLLFLISCGIAALGFLGWWVMRSEPYSLELDGQPMRIWLSRISGYPLRISEKRVATLRRGLFGGCRVVPAPGRQISGKDKPKVLPDRGGSLTIDGGEEQGSLSVDVGIQKGSGASYGDDAHDDLFLNEIPRNRRGTRRGKNRRRGGDLDDLY